MTTPSAMGVSFCASTRVFRLQTASTVYVMRISDARAVEHLYYGPTVGADDDLTFLASSNVGQPMDAQWRPPLLTPATAGGHAALNAPAAAVFPSVGGVPAAVRPVAASVAATAAASRAFPPATVTVASSSSGVSSSASSDSLCAAGAGEPGSLPSMGGLADLDTSPDGQNVLDVQGGGALPGSPGDSKGAAPAARRASGEGLSTVLSQLTLPKSSTQESVANVDDLPGSLPGSLTGQVSKGGDGVAGRVGAGVSQAPALPVESLTAAAPGAALPHLAATLPGCLESRPADRFSSTNWASLDPNRAGANSRLVEFGSRNAGDYRTGSMDVLFADGSSAVSLEYVSHRVTAGKVPREDAEGAALPAVYVDEPDEATTLTLEMVDPDTGLIVELHYVVMHTYDIITRWSTVRNQTAQPVVLQRLASATVDMETAPSRYMTSLAGAWARERQLIVRRLVQGTTSFGSTRGGSSHQHNPFLAVSTGGEPQEESGDVMAMVLVYSGNFEATAEVNEQGRLRVSMGIHPDGFRWTLPRGGFFASPEVLLTTSGAGIGPASRRLHRLIRDRLMPRRWRHVPRPLLLNTWEANYFAVSHEGVMDIARAAVPLGIDTVVLDDGWFSSVGRSSAISGLGDWFPNKAKLPNGIAGLAADMRAVGMKLGLWIEPESVNPVSELFRAHPDWALQIPGRSSTVLARTQLVLDMSREDVRDYLFDSLSVLLSAGLSYLKWDFNRWLAPAYSVGRLPVEQGTVAHRYICGVYSLLARLAVAYPKVLIEGCTGGGGRFDCGMLAYSPQIWTSDNTDAASRTRIQWGTSLAYPAAAMACHVSATPNHQTLREVSYKTRAAVAMFGVYGLEQDVRNLTKEEAADMLHYNRLAKRLEPLVLNGDLYRLWSPFASGDDSHGGTAWMTVSPDQSAALVTVVTLSREVGAATARLCLRGLTPDARYLVEEIVGGDKVRNLETGQIMAGTGPAVYQITDPSSGLPRVVARGATLMRAGLPLRFEFVHDAVIFQLTRLPVLPVPAAVAGVPEGAAAAV